MNNRKRLQFDKSSFKYTDSSYPKFEIFKKDSSKQFLEILIDIRFGKSYLPNLDQRFDQKPQKGGTCFYYALNSLRPRCGKFFSETYSGRDIEKKISNFRKQMTELTNLHFHLLTLSKSITHDKTFLKQVYESTSPKEIIEKIGKPFFEVIDIYIKNEKFSLEGVINFYIAFETMNKAKNLLLNFGINPENAVKEYKNKYFSKLTDELSFGEQCSMLMGATYEVIANKYHIKYTKWSPEQGFIGLAEAIEKEGAIAVSCGFSDFSITNSKSQQKKFGKWDLYGWNDTDFIAGDKNKSDFNIIINHRILIVGLQQYGKENHVIYMDSNSPNTVNGPNRIFKIPYDYFILCLNSVHPFNNGQEIGKIGPYGYIADINFISMLLSDIKEKRKMNEVSLDQIDQTVEIRLNHKWGF